MIESRGRDTFFEHKNDVWGAYHWLMDQPVPEATGEQQLTYLMDDLAIRELLTSYTDSFDSRNYERVISHFTDDAILVNPRLTFVGKQEIEDFYKPMMNNARVSFHRVLNVVVRVEPGASEGWIIAYFHAAFAGQEAKDAQSQLGHYFGRAVKQDGRWRIADWRISFPFVPAYAAGSIDS